MYRITTFFHLIEAAKTSQSVNHFSGVNKSTDLRLLRPVQNFSLLVSFKKKKKNETTSTLNQ